MSPGISAIGGLSAGFCVRWRGERGRSPPARWETGVCPVPPAGVICAVERQCSNRSVAVMPLQYVPGRRSASAIAASGCLLVPGRRFAVAHVSVKPLQSHSCRVLRMLLLLADGAMLSFGPRCAAGGRSGERAR